MFLKSLIATIIIMVLTGGLIYWGTAPDANDTAPVAIIKPNVSAVVSKKTENTGWVDLTKSTPPAKVQRSERPKSIGKILNEGLEDARAIKDVDLQDKAHLRLIDTAIEGQAYSRAINITELLSTEALRDEGKLTVALGLVNGRQQRRAYSVLIKLENEDFKETAREKLDEAVAEKSTAN